jgi:hypothetical protein
MIEKHLENHEAAAARRLNERKSRRQLKSLEFEPSRRPEMQKTSLLRQQQTLVNKLRNEHLEA